MKLKKYTLEQLKEAIKTSTSIRQVLFKLNLVEQGGNYSTFHKAVKYYNLDTSHFTGQNMTGRKFPSRRKPIEEYLINESNIKSNELKKYLLDDKIFEHKCYKCNLTTWNNLPIPLELEHINGIHSDNRLENLTLLCPNCHAQTDTYRGKNIKKKIKPKKVEVKDKPIKQKIIKEISYKNNCLVCNTPTNNEKYCSSVCQHKKLEKFDTSKENIIKLLKEFNGNLTQISKFLNISDNGFKRWCKKYEINIKDYK